MKFRSSTFSFETLRAVGMPAHWRASISLLIILLLSAELAARVLMAPLGEHLWAYSPTSSAASFEWYRHLATSGRTPDVVAIGDSTGARNFDPAAFAAQTQFEDVYSLARAGNFPLALRSNTIPLLEVGDPPIVVLLLQSAGSFRDDPRVGQIERGAMSPILDARRDGRPLVTDYLHLARLFPARSLLRTHWIDDEPLLKPSSNGSFSPFHLKDEQRMDTPVVESLPTMDVRFSEERRGVILELLEVARMREFPVIAVVGPQRGSSEDVVTDLHLRWLRGLAAAGCGEFAVLDMRNAPYVESGEYKDNNHLYSKGAAKFSARLAAVIEEALKYLQAERSRSTCSQDAEWLRQKPSPDE